MAYLPDSIERTTTDLLNEQKLGLPPLLTGPHEPRVAVESYVRPDGSTIFAALSYVALDAQAAADAIDQPLREADATTETEPWQRVQSGLRYIGHGRRRIRRAARRSGRLDTLQRIHQDALDLSSVMNFTGHEKIHHVDDAEVFSDENSRNEADKNLRLVSSKKLTKLINTVLGEDIDVGQLKDWLRAVRKRPGSTDDFESFFEGLRREMQSEGYEIDSSDELLDNLSSDEYGRLKNAIWQEIFESFKAYSEDDNAPDVDVFIRSGDIPSGVRTDKQTKIDLGGLGLGLFMKKGGYKGPIDFRAPVAGRVIRPVLVWHRFPDGSRQLRFDTYLYGRDEPREQVFHYSPLVGAAILAAQYGDTQIYSKELDNMKPYPQQPRGERPSSRERAGLWPLVSAYGQNELLRADYVTQIELLAEERRR